MADSFEVNLTGVDELSKKLESISKDMKFKGGRFALRKAANIFKNEIKAGAERIDDPNSPERIADNVAVRWSGKTFKRSGNLHFRVGMLGGARKENKAVGPGGKTYHWRFKEFGTATQAAEPFVRPAKSKSQAATNEFIAQYSKAIDRAIKRAGK